MQHTDEPRPEEESTAGYQQDPGSIEGRSRLEQGGLDGYEGQFAPDEPEQEAERDPGPDLTQLGSTLDAEFNEAARRRQSKEQEWLKNLRAYKGQYEPEVLAALDENQSRIFIRLPKVKVRTVLARFMNLLFPSTGQSNWELYPSPNADLPEPIKQALVQQFAEEKERAPTQDEFQAEIQEKARKRCARMAEEIQDQLAESPGRVSYQKHIRNMGKSALIYGTGVFKGPLVRREDRARWVQSMRLDHETGREQHAWELQEPPERYLPYYEAVPIWNAYPDQTASSLDQCRYFWQTHIMTRTDLRELRPEGYFDVEAIEDYIKDYPDGDANYEDHERQLRELGEEDIPASMDNRYRVKERWGMLTGRELSLAGVDIPQEEEDREFWSNVWLLGDRVIKAVMAPVRGVEMPFYLFYYDKDESSIWGDGMLDDMRDPMAAFNAALRKGLDQYAISGPMWGVNESAMAPGEDTNDIYTNRVFRFTNAEDMDKAIINWIIPSFLGDGINMAKFMQDYMDEVSAPRFMHGDGQVKGAGETMGGLSMLMGAQNVNMTDLVKNFDVDVNKPFITAMFNWNMQFNPREDIKGDFYAVARGSTALMAKEVKAEKLVNAAQFMDSPRFEGWIDEEKLLHQLFDAMDIPPEVVRSKDQYREHKQMMMMAEAEAKSQADLKTLLDEMRSRGINPEQALTDLLQNATPAVLQRMQQAQAGGGQEETDTQPPRRMT